MEDCLEYTPTKNKIIKIFKKVLWSWLWKQTQPGRFKTNFDVAIW